MWQATFTSAVCSLVFIAVENGSAMVIIMWKIVFFICKRALSNSDIVHSVSILVPWKEIDIVSYLRLGFRFLLKSTHSFTLTKPVRLCGLEWNVIKKYKLFYIWQFKLLGLVVQLLYIWTHVRVSLSTPSNVTVHSFRCAYLSIIPFISVCLLIFTSIYRVM